MATASVTRSAAPGGFLTGGFRGPILVGILSLLMASGACGVTDPDLDTTAVVQYVDVEGGCWAIEVGDERFQPINLPDAFKQDDLEVRLVAEAVEAASVCQVGPLVQILEIEAIR